MDAYRDSDLGTISLIPYVCDGDTSLDYMKKIRSLYTVWQMESLYENLVRPFEK